MVKDGVVEVNGEGDEGDGRERRNGSDMEERGENEGGGGRIDGREENGREEMREKMWKQDRGKNGKKGREWRKRGAEGK